MELQLFQNAGFNIRGGLINNEPFFVFADVCKVLDIKNPSDAIKQVDDDERARLDLGRQGEAWAVTESGLYRIVMRSDKQQAKPFQKWVSSEVLPSIRKHGIYATETTIESMISNPDFAIQLLTTLKEEKQARIEAERRNAILMHSSKTYTTTEIAKELGLKSAIALNNKLSDKKVQFKQNGTWVLYSKYSDLGYTDIKQTVLDSGKIVYDRHWTNDGRMFILELLK
jgi:prophage antirepressor-like protein